MIVRLSRVVMTLMLFFFTQLSFGQQLWQSVNPTQQLPGMVSAITVSQGSTFYLDQAVLKASLAKAGLNPENGVLIPIVKPDGLVEMFKVWETPVLPKVLVGKYPFIKTYTGVSEQNPYQSIKLDVTLQGFHAQTFGADESYMIEPFNRETKDYYLSFYRKNVKRDPFTAGVCLVNEETLSELQVGGEATRLKEQGMGIPPVEVQKPSTQEKRTFNLALSCTGEYAQAVGGANPTKASVLSAMVTIINRVNGIYEREIGVTLVLHDQVEDLIYLDPQTDPFTANNNGSQLLGQNQRNTDQVIGRNNYDMGHIFSTGGGGIANLGSVCYGRYKARGVTGLPNPVGDAFAVDYVAHEMGHQLGANHSFNSCGGNENSSTAFEPGSGSTIMCYAGICGLANNIQNHSDDYFHTISLKEITEFLTDFYTDCGLKEVNTVSVPQFGSIAAQYVIPANTPFELLAPEVNLSHGNRANLSYSWEQWDLGNLQLSEVNGATSNQGPIFRSFYPKVANPLRVFTSIDTLVKGYTNIKGERLPEVDRHMKFKLAVRNIENAWGSFRFSDDEVAVQVVNKQAPFKVTYPDAGGISLRAGASMVVTWNTVGTETAPINCDKVDVYFSADGGLTYPYIVGTELPNTGTAHLQVPNVNTATGRIKVKGHDNIFFDLSDFDFTITGATGIEATWVKDHVNIYPNPATSLIKIRNYSGERLTLRFLNALGQELATYPLNKELDLNTQGRPRGLYLIQLVDQANQIRGIEKVILK